MRVAGLVGLALALAACSSATTPEEPTPTPYRPTGRDYAAFASAWPDLLEPNYLPFMVHRASVGDGELLFFCRWPDDAMPLAVHVGDPVIPAALQDEFHPREPARYAEAVRRALATWEGALEGLVRFRLVEREGDASLRVRLIPERAPVPEPDLKVLGATSLLGACQPRGTDPDAERLDVRFEVRELRLFLADEFGLLSPDQVEWIALHEVGHALGMRGHSPIPADLMYEVARDRIMVNEGLSMEDVNSFVSLYQLPSGTLFSRVSAPSQAAREPSDPGPPRLAMAPYVDARHGFEFRPPGGWLRVPTPLGMVAVHGVTWDYTASFQIVVQRFPTIEAYLERYAGYYLNHGRLSRPAWLVVNGRRALQVEIEVFEAPRFEQVTLVEIGDGRVLVIIAECPPRSTEAYRPWFSAALASLEITEHPEEGWPAQGRERRPREP
jgi:hypothetical protein